MNQTGIYEQLITQLVEQNSARPNSGRGLGFICT